MIITLSGREVREEASSEFLTVSRYRADTYSAIMIDVPGQGGHTRLKWEQISLMDIIVVCADLSVGVESARSYLQYIRLLGVPVKLYLVGTKVDCMRPVMRLTAERVAVAHGAEYLDISTSIPGRIERVFKTIFCHSLLEKYPEYYQPKRSKCCNIL